MKTLAEYLALPYRMEVVEDQDEGGFVAFYPDLPGCISCGETIESAASNALEAKNAWLEAAIDNKIEINEPGAPGDCSGQFTLRLPRNLYESLAEHSKREGISMNEYCVKLLSKNDAAYAAEHRK